MWRGMSVGSGVLALLAGMAAAAEPLDGAQFEAHVTGQTLQFSAGGKDYGAEQYLPGRRVIWAFDGGPCREGIWYEAGPGQICFVYEHEPVPQCWSFFDESGRLRARFLDATGMGEDLIEARRGKGPLACPGPDVGA